MARLLCLLRLLQRSAGPVLALALLLAAVPPLHAQDLQPVPPLTARVIDRTATLSPAQRQALESKLARFEQEHGTQIVVLMLGATAPEDIASYAHRVADTWKIGRREVGDGLLMVIAKDERRVRIEVARTLEGAIPDLAASRIIQETLRPAFRAGDFAGGIDAALNQLMTLVRAEALPSPGTARKGSSRGPGLQDLAIFLFIGVPVIGAVLTAMLGRKLGSITTGLGAGGMGAWLTGSTGIGAVAGVLALLLMLMMGVGAPRRRRHAVHAPVVFWGGGGGGFGGGGTFGGGGGFSSGGGGGFGGGGASGSW